MPAHPVLPALRSARCALFPRFFYSPGRCPGMGRMAGPGGLRGARGQFVPAHVPLNQRNDVVAKGSPIPCSLRLCLFQQILRAPKGRVAGLHAAVPRADRDETRFIPPPEIRQRPRPALSKTFCIDRAVPFYFAPLPSMGWAYRYSRLTAHSFPGEKGNGA